MNQAEALRLLGEISQHLPAWIIGLIAVVWLLERMGFIQRRARRTDAVEGPMFEAMGASATTVHNELRRGAEIIERQGKENARLAELVTLQQAENLALVQTINTVTAQRKRMFDMLMAVNKAQNELQQAGLLEGNLVDGITEIRTDFTDTRFR